MKIGIIQASSQIAKNELLYSNVCRYAPEGSEIVNFGCFKNDPTTYSYIEISIMIGLLLESKAVDFVVSGCSSGQGMMLACNSMPGVLCGYAPTPKDAYLFAQINNGNALSLPLGEDYTYQGEDNLAKTIEALFKEPFGQGYPKSDAARKIKDSETLKQIRTNNQVSLKEALTRLEPAMLQKVVSKHNVIEYVTNHGSKEVCNLLKALMK